MGYDGSFPLAEISLYDMTARFIHKVEIEAEVVDGSDLECEQLLTDKQMPYIGREYA